MCGRLWQALNLQYLIRLVNAGFVRNRQNFNPSYNQGPTHFLPAIRRYNNLLGNSQPATQVIKELNEEERQNEQQQQQLLKQDKHCKEEKKALPKNEGIVGKENSQQSCLDFMQWGFAPSKNFHMVINARIEEVTEKRMFKGLVNKQRCVVISQGFYEWDNQKNPYAFQQAGKDYLLLAALYTSDEKLIILTQESFGQFGKIHSRLPVLLDDDDVEPWLDCDNFQFEQIYQERLVKQRQCKNKQEGQSIWDRVDLSKLAPFVNDIKEKSVKCLLTYEQYQQKQIDSGIMKFFQPKNKNQESKTEQLIDKQMQQDINQSKISKKSKQKQINQQSGEEIEQKNKKMIKKAIDKQ